MAQNRGASLGDTHAETTHRARLRGRPRRRRRLSGLALLIAVVAFGGLRAEADEVVALVHPSNDHGALSVKDLRLLYNGSRAQWRDGTPVMLLLPASGSSAMDFLIRRVLRRPSEDDVKRLYVKLIYQQKITRLPQQLSTAEALALVQSVRGAIALAERSAVGTGAGVRVLSIDDAR